VVVTPDELALIAADGDLVQQDPRSFATDFYDTLFEIAPSTRALFPDDLVAQRGKLVDELGFLVEAATASGSAGDLDAFVERAHDLGSRHVRYGVSGSDYAPVGVALTAALRNAILGWDAAHELAWTKLFRLISDVMREGAESGANR
jgi:nitric oxide dioxygenase